MQPNKCKVLSAVNLNWLDPEVLPIFFSGKEIYHVQTVILIGSA